MSGELKVNSTLKQFVNYPTKIVKKIKEKSKMKSKITLIFAVTFVLALAAVPLLAQANWTTATVDDIGAGFHNYYRTSIALDSDNTSFLSQSFYGAVGYFTFFPSLKNGAAKWKSVESTG